MTEIFILSGLERVSNRSCLWLDDGLDQSEFRTWNHGFGIEQLNEFKWTLIISFRMFRWYHGVRSCSARLSGIGIRRIRFKFWADKLKLNGTIFLSGELLWFSINRYDYHFLHLIETTLRQVSGIKSKKSVRKPSLILLLMKHVIADLFSNSFWEHRRAIWIFYQPMRDRDLEWRRQAQYKGMTIFVIDSYSL